MYLLNTITYDFNFFIIISYITKDTDILAFRSFDFEGTIRVILETRRMHWIWYLRLDKGNYGSFVYV
jgi:hypothetical protein